MPVIWVLLDAVDDSSGCGVAQPVERELAAGYRSSPNLLLNQACLRRGI